MAKCPESQVPFPFDFDEVKSLFYKISIAKPLVFKEPKELVGNCVGMAYVM